MVFDKKSELVGLCVKYADKYAAELLMSHKESINVNVKLAQSFENIFKKEP